MACSRADRHVRPPEAATVCDIWAKPKAFVGRPVTLDTFISADGVHLALLMGPSCDRGLRFTFASSVSEATQDAIRKAIFQPWPGTSGKRITARFTGTLRKDPEEQRFLPYVFEVSSVANLEIEIGKRPW